MKTLTEQELVHVEEGFRKISVQHMDDICILRDEHEAQRSKQLALETQLKIKSLILELESVGYQIKFEPTVSGLHVQKL